MQTEQPNQQMGDGLAKWSSSPTLQPVVVLKEKNSMQRNPPTSDNDVPAYMTHLIPRSQERMVGMAMTLLFALLVSAMFLSFRLVPQFRFLIGMFWVALIGLFWALVVFVQSDAMRHRGRVFHPFIHAAVDILQREFENFGDDWRQEILLVTNTAHNPDMAPDSGVGSTEMSEPTKRKRKSKIFTALVVPFLPLFAGRRRARRNTYVPPETEMI
jgi:hypothetical protein